MRTEPTSRTEPSEGAPSPASSKKGFTLVEAMVGLVIVGVVLVGVFATFGRSFDLIERARDSARVAQIIQSELEDMRTLSWNQVSALPTWAVYSPSSAFSEEFGNRYTCYRHVYTRFSDQLGLRVYVLWVDSSGDTKYDFYETWYTRGGFNDYYYRSF